MRTLASVLEAALQRSAAEITLESEQPVIYRTARGSEAEQTILRRPDLFDMLAVAVSDELQVELMLGNAIEFDFEAQQTKWRIRAVPGADAMVVRAERVGGLAKPIAPPTDDLAIELDDADQFGLGLDGPPEVDDPDFDLDGPSPPPRAAAARRPAPSLAPTLTDEPVEPRPKRKRSEPSPAAFESGTWALDDEDEGDFDLDPHARTMSLPASESSSSGKLPRGFPTPPEPSYSPAEAARRRTTKSEQPAFASRRTVNDAPAVGADFIGVPADDDEQPIGGVSVPRRSSTKLAAVRAGQARTVNEMAPLASPQAETRRELSAVGSPDADTHRELNAVVRAGAIDLAGLAADIAEGTLVYLLENGLAEQLANALQAPTAVLDDEVDPNKLWSRVRTLAPGSILIIKREDPSALLGWILRRLEEGYRVFLDTRARTPEGARRILLGTAASERAEAWLAAQPQRVVEAGASGPQLRAVSR
ncbi:hypothetical protein ACNOYE_35760 [Nannocystaceae bacterium ST9]